MSTLSASTSRRDRGVYFLWSVLPIRCLLPVSTLRASTFRRDRGVYFLWSVLPTRWAVYFRCLLSVVRLLSVVEVSTFHRDRGVYFLWSLLSMIFVLLSGCCGHIVQPCRYLFSRCLSLHARLAQSPPDHSSDRMLCSTT